MIKVMNMVLVFAIPPVSGMIVFAVSTFTAHPLDAILSFTIMSLFNTMRFPLVMLPKSLRGTSGGESGRVNVRVCLYVKAIAVLVCAVFVCVPVSVPHSR